VSIVLRGTIRSALGLLERYGCIKESEAEGIRWLIEDPKVSEPELRALLMELRGRVLGCDNIPMPIALSFARQISEVIGSE
jgi:hypothetical protein